MVARPGALARPSQELTMSKASEYRQTAVDCSKQAKLSITPLDRQHWLRLAENWLKLACAAEREADE
jgi:hypothetical protein